MKKNTDYIVKSAVIGAFYAALTLCLAPMSFSAIQLRVSEALCVLPIFTPAAVPGLFIGCLISNGAGITLGLNSAGVLDLLFGSAATLAAAILTRMLRNITLRGFPLLSFLPPILINALVIGLELSVFLPDGISYAYAALTVGAGEATAVLLLGIPLYFMLNKFDLSKRYLP